MNETYEFSDRVYLKPELDRDERLAFVDKLRETRANEVERINQDTHALGTQVPSNLGGLGGAEGVWEQRYVDPQTEAVAAQLRATAQASALNTVLSNMQSQYKKAYNDAYLNAKKRNRNRNSGPGPAPAYPKPDDGVVNRNGYTVEPLDTVMPNPAPIPDANNSIPEGTLDSNINGVNPGDDIRDVVPGKNPWYGWNNKGARSLNGLDPISYQSPVTGVRFIKDNGILG